MANKKKMSLDDWLAQNPGAHSLTDPRIITTGGNRDGGYSGTQTPSAGTSGTPTADLNSLANSANYGKLIALLAQSLGTDESTLLGMLGLNMNDMDGWQQADWNKQLLDQLMSLSIEYDKRGYNEKMLADQRLYDNPQNQLARLMGAGISRDAAIQMLSGGSGSGGSGVVTGDAAALASGVPATQSTLNGVQTGTSIAGSVFGAISAISGLVSLGFSIPQAIAQTSALQLGNALSQKALIGLQSADAVLGALQDAVSIGALSTKDMDGFSNATDALNYIYDHQDTNAFKPIFQNGSFAQVYGTKLGRDMFAQAWQSVRQSKDGGTMLDNYIQQNIAKTELSKLDVQKNYQELQYAIGELCRQDVEIQKLWNDVWEGNIKIEIAGQELKVKRYEGTQAETFESAFNAAYNQKYGNGSPDTRGLGTGVSMLAYSTWSDLCTQYIKAFAMNGTQERQMSWEKFFQNNNEAAQLLAGIQLSQAQIQSAAANPELNPLTATLFSIWTLAKMTGAYDVVKIAADQGSDFLPYILTPNKPK